MVGGGWRLRGDGMEGDGYYFGDVLDKSSNDNVLIPPNTSHSSVFDVANTCR